MTTPDSNDTLFDFNALDAADFPAAEPSAPPTPPPALPESLVLDRPLVFFDIEATGLDVGTDRIISIALVRYAPTAEKRPPEQRYYLLNPGRNIPPESTQIHGITDEKVRLCPTFDRIADELGLFLEGADLGGYNLVHFDIPILQNEFRRVDIPFSVDRRRVIDPQAIFFHREPRTLSAAVQFYCGHPLDDAHDARADIFATIEVLSGQYKRYGDLPANMAGLDDYCVQRKPNWVDRSGRLCWQNGEIAFNFSKNKGRTVRDIVRNEPGFIDWILKGNFPDDLKEILRKAKTGTYPALPGRA